NRRVPSVCVRDGQSINLGNPDGPKLTFEVGRHEGAVGRPPQTTNVKLQPPPAGPSGRVQTPQPVSSGPQAAAPPRDPPGPPSRPPFTPRPRPAARRSTRLRPFIHRARPAAHRSRRLRPFIHRARPAARRS